MLVRLPLHDALAVAEAVMDAGAGALVVAAPPRGTARDPHTGKLVSGRVYGPLVKPAVLRVVGQLARKVDIPVIGAGGIHTQQDARDYIEAGARAVQVISPPGYSPKSSNSSLVTWVGGYSRGKSGRWPTSGIRASVKPNAKHKMPDNQLNPAMHPPSQRGNCEPLSVEITRTVAL